jgi:hypothetical protein
MIDIVCRRVYLPAFRQFPEVQRAANAQEYPTKHPAFIEDRVITLSDMTFDTLQADLRLLVAYGLWPDMDLTDPKYDVQVFTVDNTNGND